MWIDPGFRKSGIGKKIVSVVVAWLKERGTAKIYAWVANSNSTAIGFYKSLGFVPTGETAKLPSNPEESETLFLFVDFV
jgi:ribosomal protein S18 acetylase RimI-like enzyme